MGYPNSSLTQKLTSGPARVRRGVCNNGWIPFDVRGHKLLFFVFFGTVAVVLAIVGAVLSSSNAQPSWMIMFCRKCKLVPCVNSLDSEVGVGCWCAHKQFALVD